jgi:hypothetical protein
MYFLWSVCDGGHCIISDWQIVMSSSLLTQSLADLASCSENYVITHTCPVQLQHYTSKNMKVLADKVKVTVLAVQFMCPLR